VLLVGDTTVLYPAPRIETQNIEYEFQRSFNRFLSRAEGIPELKSKKKA
jgi:hypothetical protein